jgi:5-methylcytosine-specific restriction endonuclease McrA
MLTCPTCGEEKPRYLFPARGDLRRLSPEYAARGVECKVCILYRQGVYTAARPSRLRFQCVLFHHNGSQTIPGRRRASRREIEKLLVAYHRFLDQRKRKSLSRPSRWRLNRLQRRALLAIFGGRCLACGSASVLELDHVIPGGAGGSDRIENLQVLCKRCHLEKTRAHASTDYRPRHLRGRDLLQAVEDRLPRRRA